MRTLCRTNLPENRHMNPITIQLPDCMDIAACANLHKSTQDALALCHKLEFSAAEVSRVGTPSIQWLVSVMQNAVQNGKAVTLVNPSPVLLAAAHDLGLGAFFPEYKEHTA